MTRYTRRLFYVICQNVYYVRIRPDTFANRDDREVFIRVCEEE